MKSNPLFIDSTKFHGDVICTQFDLRHILIYDDETVFVIVNTAEGESTRMPMKALDEGGYSARVHLNHQTLISYRFEIEKAGSAFLYSRGFKTRVQYAIVTDWSPTDEDPKTFAEVSQGSTSIVPFEDKSGSPLAREEWPRTQVASIRSMMDRFGF